MSFNERLRKAIEESTFCYEKEKGHGLVDKKECACVGKEVPDCQAYKDQERFHKRVKELGGIKEFNEDAEYTRDEMLVRLKPEFVGSMWWRENIK